MDLRDIHMIGASTREWIVSSDTCPGLVPHHIRMVGISETRPPFRFQRTAPGINQILVSESGTGLVRIGGEMVSCGAGMAYVTPQEAAHAYEARGAWNVCWIMLQDSSGVSLSFPDQPVIVSLDPRPIKSAIQGLYRETTAQADPAVQHHWIELIHLLARRIVGPAAGDARLSMLWEKVDADLAHSWTLEELAHRMGFCSEQLRRLCQRQTGMSPMAHVAQRRMHRAAAMLSSAPLRVEAVAQAVGYSNPFAFSTAFRRCMGRPPTAFR